MADVFNVVLSNAHPVVDEEARLARYRRALELLNEAQWLWDEYMADQNRALLGTSPGDVAAREEAYTNIRVAAELKAHLVSICNEQTYIARRNERAERRNGG
jgi:hypothetical protein